jgi:hypothetical protein
MNPKMAKFANSKAALAERSRLERAFLNCHAEADKATHALRINRVHAGQILLTLKDGFDHGDWLPYLTRLSERANVPTRTARQYMQDADIASKLPAALIDEAKQQGWDTTTRMVRDNLVDWLLHHPTDTRSPQNIIKDALGAYVPPEERVKREAAEAERGERAEQAWQERLNSPEFKAAQAQEDAEYAREDARKEVDVARLTKAEKLADEVITAGYRALSKKFHPDAGGSSEQFQSLTDAKELLQARLQKKLSRLETKAGIRR